MGDFADMAREQQFDWWIEEQFIERHMKRLLKEKKWQTKDKQILLISEMKVSHIVNCINMIERSNFTWRPEFHSVLIEELDRRKANANSRDY